MERACSRRCVSMATLRRMIRANEIETVRVGRRVIIPESALVKFFEQADAEAAE